ncbi:hypothetical protein [Arthrobacter sp. H41]|uniref:hypothetical protein n=1 Tax=Arthrobacter sp. H41 TaxID=1312978 RepID=UPI00047A905D|nr:hypothetical protein [Arthrobacter sp. H41]
MQWIKKNKRFVPSAFALTTVVVFWIVGAAGGMGFLHDAESAMAMLAGLYLMLGVVAVSIIVTVLALMDLAHVTSDRKQRTVA